jgi:hypothetical protein
MALALPEDLQCTANGNCAAPPAPSAGDGELRWLRRCVEAAGKGFAIGAGLKGGLALFSVLVRIRSRRSPRSREAGAMANEEAVVLALKETVRYGLFLGAFAGSYVSVDEYIAAVWGRKRSVHRTFLISRRGRCCAALWICLVLTTDQFLMSKYLSFVFSLLPCSSTLHLTNTSRFTVAFMLSFFFLLDNM